VRDGALLVEDRAKHPDERLSDYSYLVFPYAKLYEGFLKQLFLDLKIIKESEYQGEHFRVGKVLSPNLVGVLKSRSAYGHLATAFGQEVADLLWIAWKQGRNMVFHYFPHNLRRLTYKEAEKIITELIGAMVYAVTITGVKRKH
jgi:hypothetical protein